MTQAENADAGEISVRMMNSARKLKQFLVARSENTDDLEARRILRRMHYDAWARYLYPWQDETKRFLSHVKDALGSLHAFVLLAVLPAAVGAQPIAEPASFRFAVIGAAIATTPKLTDLRAALSETDADNLAFVVVHGIKPRSESCKDDVYLHRREQLQQAKNGLIVSLAGSDWAQCSTPRGRSNAVERLNRLREFFFIGDFSLGATKLPLMRQSASPQFRGIGENARWEIGNVLFATINLPGWNNRYITDAGRNSEFEDRLVANRAWLKRLMTIAAYRKFAAVVLFTDGDPITQTRPRLFARESAYDGYADVRNQLKQSAATYSGRLLIIHGQTSTGMSSTASGIRWYGNLGTLDASAGILTIAIDSAVEGLFSLRRETKGRPDTTRPR